MRIPDFLEVSQKKLVVCGGGHVAIPVVRIGRLLGFSVTVLEDRPEFAENARRAGADKVLCMPFEEGLAQIPGGPDTFFVIVTREHAFDTVCLLAVSRKPHAYIGVIGSRRRAALVKERMIADYGCDPEVIGSVHMPIGLPIGSETPEEIAVSIMAEIIQVKNRDGYDAGWSPELVEALRDPGRTDPVALAVVTERHGSAPRGVGARMLVRRDGSILGTIGGGVLENTVIREACRMLENNEKADRVVDAVLDADAPGGMDMACGGAVRVTIGIVGPAAKETK